jgi:hypothetical protein
MLVSNEGRRVAVNVEHITAIYVGRLVALAQGARYRANKAGGSAIWHLEQSAPIGTLRAYVEALCRTKGLPEYKARTKHELAEFALRHISSTALGE